MSVSRVKPRGLCLPSAFIIPCSTFDIQQASLLRAGNNDRLSLELCEQRLPFEFLVTAIVALVGPDLYLLRRRSLQGPIEITVPVRVGMPQVQHDTCAGNGLASVIHHSAPHHAAWLQIELLRTALRCGFDIATLRGETVSLHRQHILPNLDRFELEPSLGVRLHRRVSIFGTNGSISQDR